MSIEQVIAELRVLLNDLAAEPGINADKIHAVNRAIWILERVSEIR